MPRDLAYPRARPTTRFTRNMESPLVVKPIGEGHWAYSSQLAKNIDLDGGSAHNARPQYEVVALHDIDKGQVLGEYVGVVRYAEEAASEYVATIYTPNDADLPRRLIDHPLVIDASTLGNETRYINSVTATTPFFIRRNATMNTVWCRGRLRIIIEATHDIPQGHPIVLDYEEHGSKVSATTHRRALLTRHSSGNSFSRMTAKRCCRAFPTRCEAVSVKRWA